LKTPALPLAFSSALRFASTGCPGDVKSPLRPLCELGLRLGYYPTNPSLWHSAAGSSHELSLSYSTSGHEGPLDAGFACPLCSALRV
jgi:hypothetical protein